jgi:hypothetical protein
MAARCIKLNVDGVEATAELCEELSPRATAAFWEALPIEKTLVAAKWSGRACFIHPDDGPLRSIEALENPVTSIYPGYIVMRPRGTEVLISYGESEYRWATGTDYVTRLAKIVENAAPFLAVLARTHDEGDKHLTITRAEAV